MSKIATEEVDEVEGKNDADDEKLVVVVVIVDVVVASAEERIRSRADDSVKSAAAVFR